MKNSQPEEQMTSRTEEEKGGEEMLPMGETQYHLLAEHIKDYAFITFDTDGIIRSWNKGAEHLLQYTPAEALGKNTSIFLTKEDIEAGIDKKEMEEALMHGRAEDERWHVRKDGTSFWGSGLVISLETNGQITGFAKIFRDRTRQMTQELRKDEFISFAGHELRTPLSIIRNNVQLLEYSVSAMSDPEVPQVIENIDTQINRVARLIDDLLDLTRIASGQLALNKKRINLRELAERAAADYRALLVTHTITITESTDAYAYADPDQITQVIQNIISNAAKYSPEASSVEIKIINDQNQVGVGVTDYGIGIPEEKIQKIFERFYRVDNKKEAVEGLEIGLYVSLEIVKAHNGRMHVESAPGRGSTFYFYLSKADSR